MRLAATALLLYVVGYGYFALLGGATSVLLLPRRWLPYAAVVAPQLGWAALVAVGYPLNAALPFRVVAPLLGVIALLIIGAWITVGQRGASRRRGWRAVRWRRLWREAVPPWLLGLLTYLVAAGSHSRQGALSALVADSDAEHFADVIATLLRAPIGWSIPAHQGLEATPVGMAYHYVHASLSALTGLDTFTTALPSHFLLLALGVSGVYVFARSFLRLSVRAATLATAVYSLGALPLIVASFGWGQQTAALAAAPLGLAALRLGIQGRGARSLWTAGLLGGPAAGSLYLASAPLMGGAAGALALVSASSTGGAARRLARRPAVRSLSRLLAIGLIVGAAGWLSHLSAGAFLLERAGAGLLRADELSGRSTHVFAFAGPPELLGVAPLDLYRDVSTLDGRRLLTWSAALTPLTVLGATAGGVLAIAGVLRTRRAWPHLPAVLAVVALYWVYLRWVRPFPYGEFKLLSSVWFLVPCLAVAGALPRTSRITAHPPFGVQRSSNSWRPLPWVALAPFALSLALVGGHALHFLALPWGGTLPESAMSDARSVVRAVPPGASVYVSGELTPEIAYTSSGELTLHRAGFPSPSARAGYIVKRWHGVVTSLLAFSSRPPYGLVQRHSSELRTPTPPRAADYLLLDAADDVRLYGALPGDLASAAGTLRLYRLTGSAASRPWATLQDLAAPPAPLSGASSTATGPPRESALTAPATPDAEPASIVAAPLLRLRATDRALTLLDGAIERSLPLEAPRLPPAVLPVGESLPGRRLPATPPGASPAAVHPPPTSYLSQPPATSATSQTGTPDQPEANTGHLLIGLQAIAPAHVAITLVHPDGTTSQRDLALAPGLTWYTTPPLHWPTEVALHLYLSPRKPEERDAPAAPTPDRSLRATVRPVSVLAVPGGAGITKESLERSPAGSRSPLLTVTTSLCPVDGTLSLEAWYTYLGPREGNAQARLRDSPTLWMDGNTLPTILHLGPGGRSWRIDLTAGAPVQQRASDGRDPPAPSRWQRDPGPRWIWLEIGPDRRAALHEPPLLLLHLAGAATHVIATAPSTIVLPLLAEPVPLPEITHGTLVKGSGEDLFYVERGKLRWVPSVDLLERRGIPWRLSVLEDDALWRLPVDLPLT